MYMYSHSRHGGGDEASAWLKGNGCTCIYLSKVRGFWQVGSWMSLEDADQRSVQPLPCCQVRRGDRSLLREERGREREVRREDFTRGSIQTKEYIYVVTLGMSEQTVFMYTEATIIVSSTTEELRTPGGLSVHRAPRVKYNIPL